MPIFSLKHARTALAVFSLVPLFASSAALAKGTSFMMVVDSAYTSTSPVVSRAWTDLLVVDDQIVTEPVAVPIVPVATYRIDITAYTSTPQECDADPFITADGSVVRDGIIAANFLPFGTKVRIPDYFGDKVFEVRDRMNTRYTRRVDIWMNNKRTMNDWGLKHTTIEVLELGTNAHHWNDPEMKEARRQVALAD